MNEVTNMNEVTRKDVTLFRIRAAAYLHSKKEKNFLQAGLQKMNRRTEEIAEDTQEKMEDARIDHGSLDSKGDLLTNDKGDYVYTPEKLKMLTKTLRDINKQKVSIEPYYVKEVPKDLEFVYVEAFTGFVIPEEKEGKLSTKEILTK